MGRGFDDTMMASRHRTGLNIIRQTISVINERNKDKVSFRMHNKTDSGGNVLGCEVMLSVPQNLKF